MFKRLEIFKDVLPSFMQQKLGFDLIGEPQIPEFIEVDHDILNGGGGITNVMLNLDVEFDNITQLVYQYKQFAMLDFVEEAVDEIVDESIVLDNFKPVVELNLDTLDLSDSLKKKIIEEFGKIKSMLQFDLKADEYFREWYICGRYYIQPLYSKNPKDGIIGFHHLSPYKIIRFYDEEVNKYFYFINKDEDERYFRRKQFKPRDIPKQYIVSSDHMIFVPSGLTDAKNKYFVSHLHKAIKPANQLKLLEDSMVVYRFTRAPERRAFYVDVGRMGTNKSNQFIQNLMNKFKTRLTYDTSTGVINQSKSIMTMLEDYWLPRMGNKGTEVQTLSGGQQLGEISDILYFKRRTYRALKIPSSRADNDNSPSIDFGSSEFSREELKFARFCKKLRAKFSQVLTESLKLHLVRKRVVSIQEWKTEIEQKIRYIWNVDSYWAESKELSLLERRVEMLDKVEPYKQKHFSEEYINKNILRRSDDEIETIDKQIEEDIKKQKADPNFDENGEEDYE